jgi:hypothetical protein
MLIYVYIYDTKVMLIYRGCFVKVFHGLTALVGLGLLIVEVSKSHRDTPHSVGLLSMRDQPVTETST